MFPPQGFYSCCWPLGLQCFSPDSCTAHSSAVNSHLCSKGATEESSDLSASNEIATPPAFILLHSTDHPLPERKVQQGTDLCLFYSLLYPQHRNSTWRGQVPNKYLPHEWAQGSFYLHSCTARMFLLRKLTTPWDWGEEGRWQKSSSLNWRGRAMGRAERLGGDYGS